MGALGFQATHNRFNPLASLVQSKQQKVCSIGELRKVDVQLPKMVTISFERDLSEASAENDDVLPSKWVGGRDKG